MQQIRSRNPNQGHLISPYSILKLFNENVMYGINQMEIGALMDWAPEFFDILKKVSAGSRGEVECILQSHSLRATVELEEEANHSLSWS